MAKGNSYIQMMVSQYGENWIVAVRPEDIQRSTKRIIKDITRGNINYETYGKYFLDSKFLENLIIGISNELEINTLNLNSCKFYFQYYSQTPNLAPHINHLEALDYIYRTILDKLNAVKMYGNIGYLTDTSGLLFNYKNHLN